MGQIEERLQAMRLSLPAAMTPPPGRRLPFPAVRLHSDRAIFSGHTALDQDGRIASLRGKVGREITQEQAYGSARQTGLAILSSLKAALGDLDRVDNWLRVFGMVNVAEPFNDFPSVINGFTDLILELYGPERGSHTRSAVGLAGLPFDVVIEIEGEVSFRD